MNDSFIWPWGPKVDRNMGSCALQFQPTGLPDSFIYFYFLLLADRSLTGASYIRRRFPERGKFRVFIASRTGRSRERGADFSSGWTSQHRVCQQDLPFSRIVLNDKTQLIPFYHIFLTIFVCIEETSKFQSVTWHLLRLDL